LNAGKAGKMALGGLLVVLGLTIVSGVDKRIETLLVDLSPAWLTDHAVLMGRRQGLHS
jgi:cytochrome c-type biogenesis protein